MLFSDKINNSRKVLKPPIRTGIRKEEAEGGCGVIGLVSTIPIAGKHLLQPLTQMHNRGNGKGGGIAAIGLSATQLGVSQDTLEKDYIIQVAFLDEGCRKELELEFLEAIFKIDHHSRVDCLEDSGKVLGLEMSPPSVWRYFCRVREDILSDFMKQGGFSLDEKALAEDEIVYQNTFKINSKYYASLGEKQAFILSHGKNMLIFKLVGYAEQVISYYNLQNFKARIWIGHQRYPTKGRIWHPGGAHPFIGMNEILIHNGDFANYHAICEYLAQRRIFPLFLTDTEISVLLFDLLSRIYRYPLEWVIEALAPTTERDFDLLEEQKRKLYGVIQRAHLHASPDGPWFFIIGQTLREEDAIQLIGITDTSMLRPQVFALQNGMDGVSIGLIASEKQAIDAALESLSFEDTRFIPVADKYWNARGGSHTDGGAFVFTLKRNGSKTQLTCTNKFGEQVTTKQFNQKGRSQSKWKMQTSKSENTGKNPFQKAQELIQKLRKGEFSSHLNNVIPIATELTELGEEKPNTQSQVLTLLTTLNDLFTARRPSGSSLILSKLSKCINSFFDSLSSVGKDDKNLLCKTNCEEIAFLNSPRDPQKILVIDASEFPPEGDDSLARGIVKAYNVGWKKIGVFRTRGHRFLGCGLGPGSKGIQIDVFGSSGDYLGSGMDGTEIHVHDNGQDQLGQILRKGRIVVHGDVGQTFMYGAKGGEAYIAGNAAGRPLINAVGRPRVIINGVCLDYLAESFMAGDPLKRGGFVILNGMRFDDSGKLIPHETPYPGGNLFSLASGGAIYLRDPNNLVEDNQLNGGKFSRLSGDDWNLIHPYLLENEKMFGISVKTLLTVDGKKRDPTTVYRKVRATHLHELSSNY